MVFTIGAHAQRGLQYLVVRECVSSVRSSVTTFSATTHNETTKQRYQKRRVQKLLREKQVNKPIMQILHRLTSTGPLALCTLEVYTRSHNGGRVSTLACYLLL